MAAGIDRLLRVRREHAEKTTGSQRHQERQEKKNFRTRREKKKTGPEDVIYIFLNA